MSERLTAPEICIWPECAAREARRADANWAESAQLREENEMLRKHLDRRAAGTDPLTAQLREEVARLRELLGRLVVSGCDCDKCEAARSALAAPPREGGSDG